MYQWIENEKVYDEGEDHERREYTYEKKWKEELNHSAGFHDPQMRNSNPGNMPCKSEQFKNEVKLGKFEMTEN